MGEMNFFDIGDILTEEEANKLIEEQDTEEETQKEDPEEVEDEHIEEEDTDSPEEVDVEESNGEEAIQNEDGGSSPNAYSSIANALMKDGILPDIEEDEINAVTTPEAFAELFEKVIKQRTDEMLDERQKRIDEALGNGVEPDSVRMYEQTLQYLGSINEEALASETEEGENLRKQLIYNDLINRGYSKEKAQKELEKSFKSGMDIDDAKDALEALKDYYTNGYRKIQDDAKKKAEEAKNHQQKQMDDFKKMVLESEVKLGDTVIDKRTCQRIYDAVMKPVEKTSDGRLITKVQKFQMDNPLEFLKQLGMWFVLTEGGKNASGFTKEAVRAEKNKAIKELGNKINSSSLNPDGSLRYVSGSQGGGTDPLLSDDWKIGWS